jgi:hypothetical protein
MQEICGREYLEINSKSLDEGRREFIIKYVRPTFPERGKKHLSSFKPFESWERQYQLFNIL